MANPIVTPAPPAGTNIAGRREQAEGSATALSTWERFAQTAGSTPQLDTEHQIKKELQLLLYLLVRTDTSLHRKLIERAYSRNAQFSHPFFVVAGRESIIRVLTLWSSANSSLSVTIHSIRLGQNNALIDLTQHIKLRFLPFLPIDFRMFVELQYAPGLNGTKLITHQKDIYQTEGVMRSFAVGRVIQDFVQLTGTLAVYAILYIVDMATKFSKNFLAAVISPLPVAA